MDINIKYEKLIFIIIYFKSNFIDIIIKIFYFLLISIRLAIKNA